MPASHYYNGVEQEMVATINGKRYLLTQKPNYQNMGALGGKVTFGDYTRDSDENTSSKIWTEFTGGIGIDSIREGSDEGTYWYGYMNARNPFQLALPRETLELTNVKYPLGNFGGSFYGSDGTTFFEWDESTLSFADTTHTVGATPVRGKCVVFDGEFWVPCGSAGVVNYDGAGNGTLDTAVKAVDLIEFDNHLYAITTDKKLQSYDGSTWTVEATFLWGDTPKGLVVYMNRLEDDILYIATNRGLLAWDKTNTTTIRTRFNIPISYDAGQGTVVWRPGENLYFPAGMQLYEYNVGGTMPVGPGGKEGVPSRVRGRIVDLEPSFNSLFALLEGVPEELPGDPVADIYLEAGSYYDDPLEATGIATAAVATVMEFTGSGWHPCWESSSLVGLPHNIVTSSELDHERVFWGYGDSIFTQKLSKTAALIRQQWEAREGRFAPSGNLDTGWFDGNMRSFTKTADRLEVNVVNVTPGAWFAIDYRVDNGMNWMPLSGQITEVDGGGTVGKVVIPFGVENIEVDGVAAEFSRGLAFDRIRFRVRMETDDPEESAIIDSLVLKFVKQADPYPLFQLAIDVSVKSHEAFGRTASEIRAELTELTRAREFAWVRLGDFNQPVFRALITAERGVDETGNDQSAVRTVSVVGYPLPGYDGVPADYVYEP